MRAAVLTLLTVSAALAAVPSGHGTGCVSVWAQDDADSGRDAGDPPAALGSLGRFSGFLDGATDAEDWFSVPLLGAGETVMVETYVHDAQYAFPAPPGVVALEMWAPGADEPTHVGAPTGYGAANITFANAVAGTWHVRILAPAGGACPVAPLAEAQASQAPATYRFYYGCDPYCLDLS